MPQDSGATASQASRLGRYPEHLRAAERLLRDWGWWARTQANRPLNAASGETLLSRLQEYGPVGAAARSASPGPSEADDRMLLADALVSRLEPLRRRRIVQVVYRDAPGRLWSQARQAKQLRLSLTTLKLELTVIRELVAAALADSALEL